MSPRHAILAMGLTISASCGIPQETQDTLDAYRRRLEKLERGLGEIVPLVSCPQDIQQLFESVRDECRNSEEGVCGTTQINAAQNQLAPERRNRFFEYIRQHFVHEVAYLSPTDTEVTNEDRPKYFSQMLGYPMFRKTRYLLIASDFRGREDAIKRANIIRKLLVTLNLPLIGTPDIWPYAFKLKLDQLRPRDKPLNIGEPADLNLGIWLFRVDC